MRGDDLDRVVVDALGDAPALLLAGRHERRRAAACRSAGSGGWAAAVMAARAAKAERRSDPASALGTCLARAPGRAARAPHMRAELHAANVRSRTTSSHSSTRSAQTRLRCGYASRREVVQRGPPAVEPATGESVRRRAVDVGEPSRQGEVDGARALGAAQRRRR